MVHAHIREVTKMKNKICSGGPAKTHLYLHSEALDFKKVSACSERLVASKAA
jgi:hypothetical protein